MASVTLTDPVNGTVTDASVIANNNAALKTAINGGLDNSNVASNAAITASKISLTYTAYVPSLTASVGNPNVGSGFTATGRYANVGKLVHCYGKIVFGTGGSVSAGSGVYRVTLPAASGASDIASSPLGDGWVYDSSAAVLYPVTPFLSVVSDAYMQFLYSGVSSTLVVAANITDAAPFTWAASDEIHWSILYESV